MRTAVTMRRFPGAILLGLLASLAAHAAAFGDGHVAGGSFHDALVAGALAGLAGLLVAFGTWAWIGAGRQAEGSVLAARLESRLPGPLALAASAGVWLTLVESVEAGPRHAEPLPVLILSVAAAAALVYALAVGIVRLLAGIAVAIRRTPFVPRAPLRARRAHAFVFATTARRAGRRFVRPPPR
jgi:hypothetical protein